VTGTLSSQYDVIVIGAGPGGLMAAADLASAGHHVLVLEEHAEVGRPVHCTGVLGYDAFAELDLPQDTILTLSTAAAFRHESGEPVIVDTDRIIAAVVDRAAFDGRLAERASAAGAHVRTGSRVDTLHADAHGVTVQVRDLESPIRARVCVLACGANYRFNRELGLGVPRAFVQTAQVEMPFERLPRIDVRLGRSIAPGGFAWSVPFDRGTVPHVRLGLFCDSEAPRRFRAFAEGVARESGVDPASIPEARLKMLPLGPVRRTVADRVVAVGDAAGMVKPTTGGGIYYSLLSGRLAADVLSTALTNDALTSRDLRVYEDRWRAMLGPDIRAGLAFRALATRIGDRGISALVEVARVDGIVPLLKETADFNWHRRAAMALLRHPAFRRAVISSFWS
jgi:digeranylgeranylglycerophospholipid reductase